MASFFRRHISFPVSCCCPSSWLVKLGHPSGWVPRPSGWWVFVIMVLTPNYMSRSADLKINNFPEQSTNCDVVKVIVDYMTAESMKILCVQQCANKIARVTFQDKLACEIIQLRGELDMGGVKVAVVPSPSSSPKLG